MRIKSYLTLALVPAALVAQSPAVPDYGTVLKTETPGVEGLLKDFHPVEALQKAEALLPPSLPAFDKSSPTASMKASISFSGLTRLYLLTAKAAVQAGEWEKVLDLCTKADACAKANYEGTRDAITPIITTWTTAVTQAEAIVKEKEERIKTLQAKPGRNAQEEKDYQTFLEKDKIYNTSKSQSEKNDAAKYLKANQPHFLELEAKAISPAEQQEIDSFKVAQGNLTQGPKTIKALQANIDATKVESESCAPKIESTTKNLKEEADEISKGLATFKIKGKVVKETSGPKFEELKTKYFESVLTTKSNLESRPTKVEKMNFLYRLRHNAAGTPAVAKIDQVIERIRLDQDPFPAADKKAGKGKKAK